MKKITLFFGFLLICLVSQAGPVSRWQALQEAKSFLATKGVEMKSLEVAHRAPRKANAQESESSYYYVFNAGNDQGFVIVSGDDRTEKILGYSDSGSFDEENMPEPLKAWLEGYETEIESLVDVDVDESSSLTPRRVQEKTKKSIAPLTTSKWASGYPFNIKTPTTNGKNAAVGCTPVAFAQLIYYHRANNPTKSTAVIPTYSSNVTFDWNNMLDEYVRGKYTTTQANAVANLMVYCGRALKTNYSTSGTSKSNMLPALPTYFGFDNSISFIDREFYSVEDWDNHIYKELINGRPVLYNGTSTEAGHTFIVDGYDSNGLFHINWGWGGSYNGYFMLSIVNRYNPNSIQLTTNTKPSFTYNTNHSAMLFVSPSKIGKVNDNNGILSFKTTGTSGSTISGTYYNQSGMVGSYLYGIGSLKDDKIVLLKQGNSDYTKLYVNGSSSSLTTISKSYSLSSEDFKNKGFEYGKYKIVPIYKLSTDSEWKLCQYNIDNYSIVDYQKSGISLSLNSNSNISANNIEIKGNTIIDNEQVVKATIKNNDKNYGFSGYVYLFASKSDSDKGTAIDKTYVVLGKEGEMNVEIPFTPSSNGKYNIWIAINSSGSNYIGKSQVTIYKSSAPSLDFSAATGVVMKNYAGVDYDAVSSIKNSRSSKTENFVRSIWGNTYALNVTGINNTSSYPIKTTIVAWIREFDRSLSPVKYDYDHYTQYKDNAKWILIDVYVPAKSTIDIPVVFENLKLNSIYDIRLEYTTGTKIYVSHPMLMKPAVTTWKADGSSVSVEPKSSVTIGTDVVAVDITDASSVTKISPNGNSNILYYLGASQKVPSGIANKNVVRGDIAENITLVDGKDFFVPKRFTAKKISFTTQSSEGTHDMSQTKNWKTIALPFEVTSVRNTTDGKDIDWFHSSKDNRKNFWILKFDKLETSDNTVYFDNAEKMLAYEPYIMNIPDGHWGTTWDLRNKKITFYGENAVLHNEVNIGTNSSYYNFVGTTVTKTIDNGWLLNEEGSAFDKFIISKGIKNIKVLPFHAYLILSKDYVKYMSSANAPLRIKIAGDEGTSTGILAPFAAEEKQVAVYNLNGVKVASKKLQNGSIDMSDLPKGIYIVNGKKFIQY